MMTKNNRLYILLALTAAFFVATAAPRGAAPKFYSDDPIQREPETQDSSKVEKWEIDLFWDLAENLFGNPGARTPLVKSRDVNTIDEVPNSSWFTNRIGTEQLSVQDAVRGPLTGEGPAPGTWSVTSPKEAGFAPGFTMKDAKGDLWFVSFDAKGFPEAATGAILVANKIFWTLGYWQVENYLVHVKPDELVIADTAETRTPAGKRRTMKMSDLEDVFRRSHRSPDGSYRAIAAKALAGRTIGGFRYNDTRPDDPNDVVPHQDRRVLRALKVFGAWTNLTDLKAANTLDALTEENGRSIVTHYLQDVGSTFGMCNDLHEWDLSWEYFYQGDTTRRRLVVSPWTKCSQLRSHSYSSLHMPKVEPTSWR
jgi:hypothetical protein